MPAIPAPSVIRHPDGSVTITLSREEVEGLYRDAEKVENFIGSDEWDLNDAFQDGAAYGLDLILHPRGR